MYKIIQHVWRNSFSKIIFLQYISFYPPFSRLREIFAEKRDSRLSDLAFRHPTDKMRAAQKYFQTPEIAKRVSIVADWLNDKESYETYLDTVKFMQTRNPEYNRYHGMANQYFAAFDFIKQPPTFGYLLDCGGYIGDFSVKFRRRFRQLRTVCFEPDKNVFAKAKKIFALSGLKEGGGGHSS